MSKDTFNLIAKCWWAGAGVALCIYLAVMLFIWIIKLLPIILCMVVVALLFTIISVVFIGIGIGFGEWR